MTPIPSAFARVFYRRELGSLLVGSLCYCAMPSLSSSPVVPRLGTLVVTFPPGWQFEYSGQAPIEGSGPNSEFALISFSEANESATDAELDQYFDVMREQVLHLLDATAREKGDVRRTPGLLFEKEGRFVYAASSSMPRLGPTGYFLQYASLSKRGHHYFNFSGTGPIEEATEQWDRVMRDAVSMVTKR
jgi:hypothetical protein